MNFYEGQTVVMKIKGNRRYRNEGLVKKVSSGEIVSEHIIDVPRELRFDINGERKVGKDVYYLVPTDGGW